MDAPEELLRLPDHDGSLPRNRYLDLYVLHSNFSPPAARHWRREMPVTGLGIGGQDVKLSSWGRSSHDAFAPSTGTNCAQKNKKKHI